MAKALFRFLRGELNGYYLTNIHNNLNVLSREYKEFFLEFASQQMERGKISSETLNNLGKFAGIFIPRISIEEAVTSVRLTESEFDTQLNYEFSERGLYNTETETFEFEQKTIDDTGLPDINTLATDTKRSSLVGTEETEGYIAESETDVFDEATGKVLPSVISDTPPQNEAYSDFYGDEFLFLSDSESVYVPLSSNIFLELFKAMQTVRYNGASIKSLVNITEILCPEGLVQIDSIVIDSNNVSYKLSYSVNFEVDVSSKQDRLNVWLYVLKIKFPQIKVEESVDSVEI